MGTIAFHFHTILGPSSESEKWIYRNGGGIPEQVYSPKQQTVGTPVPGDQADGATVCVADGLNKAFAGYQLWSRYLETFFAGDFRAI